MRTLSTNFQAASQQISTGEVFLSLLKFTVYEKDELGNPVTNTYHFVNNNTDITSNGVIYNAASFELSLAADKADQAPTTSLRFDSGDRQIIRKLREVEKRPDIEMSIIMASNPDNIEIGPIMYEMESFDISDTVVNINLTVEPILNEPIPSDHYNPTLFPGLWGNVTVS